MTPPDESFDVLGPLPRGRVAIEASAGTGKTYTLAALATRYLTEAGVAPSELLIVTFTRAATAELRSRIREQMVLSASVLRSEVAPEDIDRLSAHLAASDVPARLASLEQAVSDFDAAAISTMHSFAAQLRSTLGISSAIDPDARLTTDVSTLVSQACADALAAESVGDVPAAELPTLDQLVKATTLAVGAPDMDLQPVRGTPNARPEHVRLQELVVQSLANLSDRRAGSATMGFDDVLTQLRDAMHRPASEAVLEALRNRFKVILIDEFQDTDAVQWDIFSTLFGASSERGALVLVGDPKQAIYRFRGADVDVYLGAVEPSTGIRRFTLGTNWRSDGRVMDAQHRFFAGATFGNPAIGYVEVGPTEGHRTVHLANGSGRKFPGLEVRVPIGSEFPRKKNALDTPKAGRAIERDMVGHIRMLLDTAWIHAGEDDPTPTRLRPKHVAVLVASNAHARTAQSALWRQGVPAVIAGTGSVLSSWAADQVRILLHAMEKPSDLRRVRAYALTWFEESTAEEVASATDDLFADFQEKLAGWATRLADHPVAEVLAHIWAETGVIARLLGRFEGDRHVTDLDHIAEFLYANAANGMSGVAGLQRLLDATPESAGDADADGDVVARRIESEAEAVQIMTIWKAKGLEFPVVCLPMLWRNGKASDAVVCTDPETKLRTLDLAKGTFWPDPVAADRRKELSKEEYAGERLRLLYVALTRARHHTAVWWAKGPASSTNPLSRFLFARDPDTGLLDPEEFGSGECRIPDEDRVAEALVPFAADTDGAVGVSVIERRPVPMDRWVDDVAADMVPELALASFTVDLPRLVHRWSFSSITQHVTGADPYDESESDAGAADEDSWGEVGEPGAAGGSSIDSDAPAEVAGDGPLGPLQAGTAFGTFVHGVLEHVDFAAPDLESEITSALQQQASRVGVDVTGLAPTGIDARRLLVDGLCGAIRTPLGPLFGDRSLAAIDRADRLDELSFDLRVGHRGRTPTARDIGRLVSDYLPTAHPLGPWAAGLAGGSIDVQLAGYLTGSIDLVARVPGDDTDGRFVVADYKTNQLRRWGMEPTPDDYGPSKLAAAMGEHHYPLQAVLYAVALHRYLRWRLPGDGPDTRVAGAAYLFLRGMTGQTVARPGRRTERAAGGVRCRSVGLVTVMPQGPRGWSTARADGVLRPFAEAGIVGRFETQLVTAATRALDATDGSASDGALLALALVARATRLGHVCLELDQVGRQLAASRDDGAPAAPVRVPDPEAWRQELSRSALVASEADADMMPLRPLVLAGNRLYLQRYWSFEVAVAEQLRLRRAEELDPADGGALDKLWNQELDAVFGVPDPGVGGHAAPDPQRIAALRALAHPVTVIAGGPGTGKTHTVARVLVAAHRVAARQGQELHAALAAPTGKAANRMRESILERVAELQSTGSIDDELAEQLSSTVPTTIHRLLGARGRTGFRHDHDDPVPFDLVIIDETSMVSLPMLARLLDAVRVGARLVLVGDPFQLTSIEAGTVMGDMVGLDEVERGTGTGPLAGRVTELVRGHRFDSGSAMAELSTAIRRGDADGVLDLLARDAAEVHWVRPDDADALEALRRQVVHGARDIVGCALDGRGADALEAAQRIKVLAAVRHGPNGLFAWSDLIADAVREAVPSHRRGGWPRVGTPVMVTGNDPINRLANGDVGVVVHDGSRPWVVMGGGEHLRLLAPARLGDWEPWWAMTIHKSQGSEFAHAVVALPTVDSPILTRELLYTAVTRGKPEVTGVASEEIIRLAVSRPVARASGLRDRLWPNA